MKAIKAEVAYTLAEKRRYELEWVRLEVLEKVDNNGGKFITGQRGDQILNDLVPSSQ